MSQVTNLSKISGNISFWFFIITAIIGIVGAFVGMPLWILTIFGIFWWIFALIFRD